MTTKIFTTSDLIANIPCPKCGKSYQKDVSKFIKHKTVVRLKYTCKCKHTFPVLLERRRSIRKPVSLEGALLEKGDRIPITITDISKFGIKINFFEPINLEPDSIINIEFTLNDPSESLASTKVKIKRFIAPMAVGCEFLASEHYDNLGKYFLFHF